ncbi:VOC family protein [Streptomyces pactum]|uniref:VOC family protein n=1 Tax=Streptomyces pactum TaxID=68249 RepID=A0ABS0NLM6_9ACTN|nr:VOC family protein [Streptomyces pactum]MBH5336096.1 VOC family protein [Streptomyces pactum]
MAVQPEGTPCWADATFADLAGAKRFYGAVLGWTFDEGAEEYGGYSQAYADGKPVAALAPPMPGQEPGPAGWCLYLASPDVAATAAAVRDRGGEVLMGPMEVGDFGSMLLAREPGGTTFGAWQANRHEGFGAYGQPGAFAWAEVYTREPERTDAFFPAVFPYRLKRMADEHIDFKVFQLGDTPVLGRMRMGEEFPPEVPPYINVYFGVADCDAAVAAATGNGGTLLAGPMDTPFGRFASVRDPQGAPFSVIDLSAAQGEMPDLSDDAA